MKVLGIETSCDETAVAVIEVKSSKHKAQSREEIRVLSNTISSQVKLHAKFGGVVPNLAAREHVKNIEHVLKLSLKQAKIKDFKKEIDLIAVTYGPGLGPALLVGISFARTLAWRYEKPLAGANHLKGHVYSNWLSPVGEKPKTLPKKIFPILNLIVSGGHTELVLMKNHGEYKVIGETLDDAIGEAFDKVARLLGLGYPGGPAISARAEEFSISKFKFPNNETGLNIKFPRPMEHSKNYDFSYSGLKTSVLYKVRDLKDTVPLSAAVINEICYEFQEAATDVIIKKTMRAAREFSATSLFLSGGVSANKHLRTRLEEEALHNKLIYSQPEFEYTGDNAAMIALAGYFDSKNKKSPELTWDLIDMDPNLGLDSK